MSVVDSKKSWIWSLRGKTHLCLSLCALIASEKERERECNQAHLWSLAASHKKQAVQLMVLKQEGRGQGTTFKRMTELLWIQQKNWLEPVRPKMAGDLTPSRL